MDESIATKLCLDGRVDPLKLRWTQDVSREESSSKIVKLTINGENQNRFVLKRVITVRNLQLPVQSLD